MTKLLLFAATVLCSISASAKIWRVNNNSGIAADFTTLQAAHDAANAGDTIHVEASLNAYGAITVSKKLHFMGTGYFLDQNLNLQATALVSYVNGSFIISPGAAGTILEGFAIPGANVHVRANNVVIRRNCFGGTNGGNPPADYNVGTIHIDNVASNLLITQNFAVRINGGQQCTGLLITNNYLTVPSYSGETTGEPCLTLTANTVALIKNNIFRRGSINVSNSNLSNNIMYVGSIAGAGNQLANNIGNSTQFGTANGNQSNVAMASVFELTGSYDAQWKLKAGSPAAGAGFGSTSGSPVDCGMFGGNTSYVLSGIPPVPSIYYFANQPVGSNSDPINVQIKVRSNN